MESLRVFNRVMLEWKYRERNRIVSFMRAGVFLVYSLPNPHPPRCLIKSSREE